MASFKKDVENDNYNYKTEVENYYVMDLLSTKLNNFEQSNNDNDNDNNNDDEYNYSDVINSTSSTLLSKDETNDDDVDEFDKFYDDDFWDKIWTGLEASEDIKAKVKNAWKSMNGGIIDYGNNVELTSSEQKDGSEDKHFISYLRLMELIDNIIKNEILKVPSDDNDI